MLAGAAATASAQSYLTQYKGATGPVGVALDTVGGATYLYVADEAHGNVLKIDTATGTVAATFGTGSQGNQPGQFGRPYGLAIDPTTHDLYVAERLNGRVQRINSTTGASVFMWGTNDAAFNSTGQNTNSPNPGSPQGHFQEPIGLAADASGNVYVVDHGNNRVQKFLVHQSGGAWTADPVAMWGTSGSGTGQFDHPYGAALDAAGNLWVADGANGRVQEFDSTGKYLATAGAKGTADGQFVIATWVSFDPAGALWVSSTNSDPQNGSATDINSQWVSKFDVSGASPAFVSRFGGAYGSASGQFRLPFDVAVDAAGHAYVSDYYNSRVQVFDLNAAPGTGGTGGTTAPAVSTFTLGTATATQIPFTITFNTDVTGVDAADFTVATTGGATATISSVSGSGTTYTVTVDYTGTGTVQLSLNDTGTGIADASGTALAAGKVGPTYTIGSSGGTGGTGGTGGSTAPSVSTFTAGTATATQIPFTITFSADVTGVDATDFTVVTTGGATASVASVSGTGTTYTITVNYTGTGTGTVQLNLNATGTGIADASGTALASGKTGPTYTIAASGGTGGSTGGNATVKITGVTVPADGTYRAGDALVFSITFSAPVKVTTSGSHEDDEDEGDNANATITWTAIGGGDSGRAVLVGRDGDSTLTFKYQVHGNDSAPDGITLADHIELGDSTQITDAAGHPLAATALAITWPHASLPDVVLVRANESNPGKGHGKGSGDDHGSPGNSGNAPGHGKHAKLVNLSSRVHLKGDAKHAVTIGFVVSGTGSQQLLVRAVGPTLKAYGVGDALLNLTLTVHDNTGQTVATNAGWGDNGQVSAAAAQVGAFALGAGSHDAAMVLSLAPGVYTATVGSGKEDGEALVEIYDASNGATADTAPQLVNLSTRGYVDADGHLIVGVVVNGTTPKTLLIRAVGPTLGQFGVGDPLTDPQLEIHDASGAVVVADDDWGTPPASATATVGSAADASAAATAAGAFPLPAGSKDAALLVTLSPGTYTAVVNAPAHQAGAVLVEVYETTTP